MGWKQSARATWRASARSAFQAPLVCPNADRASERQPAPVLGMLAVLCLSRLISPGSVVRKATRRVAHCLHRQRQGRGCLSTGVILVPPLFLLDIVTRACDNPHR
jgi:hypothetical protein